MPEYNFFEYVLNPLFLIPFGLVMAFFAPLAYSVWVTWEENGHKEKALKEKVRQQRAEKRAAQRARRARSRS